MKTNSLHNTISRTRARRRGERCKVNRFLRRRLEVESLEERRLLAVNVAVIDNGDDAAVAAIVAQLNDNTQGFGITATAVPPSAVNTVLELNAFDVVVFGNDGINPDSFPTFAAALNDWAQDNDGGVVGVGFAAFGIRNGAVSDLDAILPVAIVGGRETFESAGAVLDVNPGHPVTAGVNDITVANGILPSGAPHPGFSESVLPPADAWGTVLGTFGSANLGIVVGDIPAGLNPGRSVYLGPTYAGSTIHYETTQWRTGDADRLLEQAVNWAGNVPVNAPPVITTNNGSTVAQGGTDVITSAELDTTDADTPDTALVYTVTTAPANGTVRLNGTTTTTFTQANINAGLVTYVHNGSNTLTDSFTFTVTDGTSTAGPATFNITVIPIAPASVAVDSDGNLIIEGTSSNDTVTITGVGTGTGNYIVTTQQGSGLVVTRNVTGVVNDIRVNLHAGDDRLTMNNVYIRGSIVIDMESGDDAVILGNADVVSTQRDLDVDLGTDNDELNGRRIFIGRDQILVGGDGNDELTFDGFASPFTLGTSAAGNANWSGGNGNDTVHVIYAFIVGAFTIDLGAGIDAIDIFGSAASGNVSFLGGVGNDNLRVDTNFFDAALLLDTGGDDDTIFVANGLGIDIGTINTGAGADEVTIRNETQGRLNVNTAGGNDVVDIQASAVDQFFADLGDGDDELTVFFNLVRVSADLDGGPGSADRLLQQGNDIRGTLESRNFELFS
ncbi:MAG: cadherin-like domain-containing protein [Pirellulales bacterium]